MEQITKTSQCQTEKIKPKEEVKAVTKDENFCLPKQPRIGGL
jgi:hypothetical protein